MKLMLRQAHSISEMLPGAEFAWSGMLNHPLPLTI